MVLDTKWKKYKYSSGNKFLCVLLALLMVACFMSNVVKLTKFLTFYGDDVFKQNTASFYDTGSFRSMLWKHLSSIEFDVTYNSREKEKKDYIDDIYAKYKKAEKKNRLSETEIIKYIPDDEDIKYEYSQGIAIYLNNGKMVHKGDDGYCYSKYMLIDDQSLIDLGNDVAREGINFGLNENTAREVIGDCYDNEKGMLNYYNNADYASLKNIQYYAVHKDGTVITNVKTDTKAFIQSVKNGKGDSIAYEPNGKGVYASGGIADFIDNSWFNDNNNYSIYIQVDPQFSADDRFKALYQNYLEVVNINFNTVCINLIASFVLLIALTVVSCRLAGHKDGELSMAKIDKMPFDLHFALMGTAVGFAGFGVGYLIVLFAENFLNTSYYNYDDFAILFFNSGWFVFAVCAAAMLIWLMILGFATSLSRAVKCNYPIFKKLLIVKFIVLIYKVFKWFILGIFKVIGKIFKGTGRALGSYAFKPKKLHKRSVPAVVLYTFFNLVSLGIIILLFAFDEGFTIFCGFLGSAALLGADGYLVYRAVKYMKALDDLIDASEKGGPLPYNTDKLPQSLKILADSLETTNAQLQQAVIKAVKDERTKTELITNVSHDLKTPLTSVINYIDLLQKCDIEDEDAKKYMAVIAEKSNKLKRLIEDLIEASKVSSGNVTINKTLINLNELAAQAVVEETADIEKNNLHVIFEDSADKHIVMADGMKIYRVFENLLSNARKYSAPGSRVYARVYSDADYGYFEIKNISKEQLNITAEELTERFVRGDKSRSQDGNGLGLSIAKELCRLNNGELIISIDGDLFKATVKLPKK